MFSNPIGEASDGLNQAFFTEQRPDIVDLGVFLGFRCDLGLAAIHGGFVTTSAADLGLKHFVDKMPSLEA